MELSRFPLLSDIDKAVITAISNKLQRRTVLKKEAICHEGDHSECIYFILSGRVKVFLEDDSGKEIVVNIHAPGEILGELGVIEGTPRTASVAALEDTQLGILSADDFYAIAEEFPSFSLRLMSNIAQRLREATETIRKLGLMDVYRRIVVTFLNLAEEQGGKTVIRERLTQQNIADRVGASREMVARILKDLRTGEYISQQDGMIVIEKSLPHSW